MILARWQGKAACSGFVTIPRNSKSVIVIRFNILSWFATTWSQQHWRDKYILRKELSLRGAVQFTDGTGWNMVMTCINLFRAAPLVFQPVVSLRVIKFIKSLWFGWQDVVRRVINICIVPVLSWPQTIWLCYGDPITSRSSARRMILYASF